MGLELSGHFMWYLKVVFAGAWVKSMLLFGMFHRIGIPAMLTTARTMNKTMKYQNRKLVLSESVKNKELKKVARAINRLPRSVFLSSLSDILIIEFLLFIYGFLYDVPPRLNLWLVIIGVIAIVVYAGMALILAEYATARTRQKVYQTLQAQNIAYKETTKSSVRNKQFLIVGLFVTTLFITNALVFLNPSNFQVVFAISLVTVVVIITLGSVLFKMLFSAINEVGRAVSDLRMGGSGFLYPSTVDKEFFILADGVNDAAKKINDYRINLEKKVEERTKELEEALSNVAKKEQIIEQELSFASEIQKGIIQSNLNPWNGINFAATYIPRGKVSGDYYDIIRQDNHAVILIADVSGHGVPAALITMAAKNAFVNAIEKKDQPEEILSLVNDEILNWVKTQDYITSFLVSVDSDYKVTYCNAAHQPAIYYNARKENFTYLDSEGLFLGALPEASESYRQQNIQLNSGDRIYMYTDGIVESTDPDDRVFGSQRLIEVLEQFKNEPLDTVHRQIKEVMFEFTKTRVAQDDITMVSMELSPSWDIFKELFLSGLQLKRNKNYDQARKTFAEAYQLIASFPEVIYELAEVNYLLNDFKNCKDFLNFYMERYTPSVGVLHLAIKSSIKLKAYQEAGHFNSRLAMLYPHENEVNNYATIIKLKGDL